MGNLRRPLILGLSTCALLLLSSRGLKRTADNGVREGSERHKRDESKPAEPEHELRSTSMQTEAGCR